jgi:hypothetical protein
MKNNELAKLLAMVNSEQVRRAQKRIDEGRYLPLTEDEKSQVERGNQDLAASMYVERTSCPVVMANMVIALAEDYEIIIEEPPAEESPARKPVHLSHSWAYPPGTEI